MFLSATMSTGHHHLTRTQTDRIRIRSPNPSDHQESVTRKEPIRVLYVVTSSTEYNSGDKETRKGQDRFLDILVPVVLESVENIMADASHRYTVDVYLILGYNLSSERQNAIQSKLPNTVGLQIWNEAKPLNYDFQTKKTRFKWISELPITLARQHRYVIKDKLPYYDFFLAFEDDMLITKDHIDLYRQFTSQVRQYKQPREQPESTASVNTKEQTWWGPLSDDVINRLRPGFLRVEVLTSEEHKTQQDTGPIVPKGRASRQLDPSICCHHSNYVGLNGKLAPSYPRGDQLVIWETGIEGLYVRKMPAHYSSFLPDWVAVLPIHGESGLARSSYWSGEKGALKPMNDTAMSTTRTAKNTVYKRPSPTLNDFFGQSAGWMTSQQEVLQLQTTLCRSSFLPPFDLPRYQEDGMGITTDSVEYWSGGLQLYGQSCELQRVISLDPKNFSNHLIYHTANNKQKEIPGKRLVLATTLLGQLHSVKETAEQDMMHELRKDGIWYRFLHGIGFN
jgi:hypothetical protein